MAKMYDLKNYVIKSTQPVPWYPKSITLENVENDMLVYSLYGYISKINIFADKIVVSINTNFGKYDFQIPAEQTILDQQDQDGKSKLNTDEFYKIRSKVSYELVTSEKNKQEIAYELDKKVLTQAFCTGELVQVLWEDDRPLDDLKDINGSISKNLTSSGRVITLKTIRIFSSQFAINDRTQMNMASQCKNESTLN